MNTIATYGYGQNHDAPTYGYGGDRSYFLSDWKPTTSKKQKKELSLKYTVSSDIDKNIFESRGVLGSILQETFFSIPVSADINIFRQKSFSLASSVFKEVTKRSVVKSKLDHCKLIRFLNDLDEI